LVEAALKAGLSDEVRALGQIEQALSTSVQGGVDSILSALNCIDTTLTDHVTAVLADIFQEIQGQTDYTAILQSIKQALDKIPSF